MRLNRWVFVPMIAAPTVVRCPAHAAAPEMRVAVVSQETGSIAEIDTLSNSIVLSAEVGDGPTGIAKSVDGQWLYLTYPDHKSIGVFDNLLGRLSRKLPITGQPFGIAADRNALYLSDWSGNVVSRIDLGSANVTNVVAVGRGPAALALDGSRGRLYVADRDDGDVTAIDTATMRKLATISTGSAPFALALAPDGKRLYVANVRSDDLAVIDTERLEQIAKIKVGSMPYGVAVTPDGMTLLVTNQHSGTLTVIDAQRLTISAEIPVGRYPEGVIAPSNEQAYVANWFSDDVSVIDLTVCHEIRRIKVGSGPRNLVAYMVRGQNR
jgi:YVTN family beta-propeller protein